MNKPTLALCHAVAAMIAAALPTLAHADDSPLAFNLGLTSDYRFRGISQSRLGPAVQGGIDTPLPRGFYIGAWASTIRWIRDAGDLGGVDTGSVPVELDLYGGYKGAIRNDLAYDLGVLQYAYPGNRLGRVPGMRGADTTELYAGLSYGIAAVKYSQAVTPLFGVGGSRGSGYLEASASIDVGAGVALTPHIGRQRVRGNADLSYTDYALTASKDYSGLGFSLALVGADTREVAGAPAYLSPAGRNLARTGLVAALRKTF